ncbi:endo-1,4-beta-xylanase [Spartobacteria bacterium LR76]|nr:endo-1,4-beta-xylanase [Spartobacteria bacterium LR76]
MSLLSLLAFDAFAADGGFLFVTFRGESDPMAEQIYFGISHDGREWRALNGGKPVLVSDVGEKGMRDPFLLRSSDGKKFYIIATDLSINRNRNWKRAAQQGSRSIVVWESDDLVHWAGPRLVEVAPPEAGCTWAPEAIYDSASQRYLVYWASPTKSDNFAKHRIWAAWTNDFQKFSAPFIYIEKPASVIDTDIVHGTDGKYYRFTKDESAKKILMEASDAIEGTWTSVPGFSLADLDGYEGPQCYLASPASGNKPASWCLVLDRYSKGTGYQPFVTTDLASGDFTPGEGFRFPFPFRHGSILPLTEAEYRRLEAAFPEK